MSNKTEPIHYLHEMGWNEVASDSSAPGILKNNYSHILNCGDSRSTSMFHGEHFFTETYTTSTLYALSTNVDFKNDNSHSLWNPYGQSEINPPGTTRATRKRIKNPSLKKGRVQL